MGGGESLLVGVWEMGLGALCESLEVGEWEGWVLCAEVGVLGGFPVPLFCPGKAVFPTLCCPLCWPSPNLGEVSLSLAEGWSCDLTSAGVFLLAACCCW